MQIRYNSSNRISTVKVTSTIHDKSSSIINTVEIFTYYNLLHRNNTIQVILSVIVSTHTIQVKSSPTQKRYDPRDRISIAKVLTPTIHAKSLSTTNTIGKIN